MPQRRLRTGAEPESSAWTRPGGYRGAGDGRVEFKIAEFCHNLSRLIGVDSTKFSGQEIAGMMNELRPGFEAG